MTIELYNKIYNKIFPIYEKYKEHIVSIYIVGSLICPIPEIAASYKDIDLLVIVDNQKTLTELSKMCEDNKLLLEENMPIDFRLWTKDGLKKYFKDEIPETFEYQFHYLNTQEPLFGKKQKFKCRVDTDLQKYIDGLIEARNELWDLHIVHNIRYMDKRYYKWLLGAYIIANDSYTIFTYSQKQNLIALHNTQLLTEKVKEIIVNWFDPIFKSKYFINRKKREAQN